MPEKLPGKIIFIGISLLFLAIGIIGYFRASFLPGVQFEYADRDGKVLVTGTDASRKAGAPGLKHNDQLLELDGKSFKKIWELDFLIDRKNIGDSALITLQRAGVKKTLNFILVERYGQNDKILIYNILLLGILFWLIGIYVYQNKPGEWAARVFYCACMTIVVSTMIIWPGCPQNNDPTGYFLAFCYWLIFPLAPAFMLYFTILYPIKKRTIQRRQNLPILIFRPSFVFIILLEAAYFTAVITKKPEAYRYFYYIYNYGFRIFLILYVIMSVGCLIHSYYVSDNKENRKKVQWILWGICLGMFPFIFLWNLPQVLDLPPLIPEIIIYIFMMVIPVAIGFSIVKYHALDIDFIIKKSIVYMLATIFFISAFLLIVEFAELDLRRLISVYRTQFLLIIVVLTASFSPIISRRIISVYKAYFKGDYSYRLVIKEFSKTLASTRDQKEIINLLIKKINSTIPAQKTVLLSRNTSIGAFEVIGSSEIATSAKPDFSFKFSNKLVKAAEQQRIPYDKASLLENREKLKAASSSGFKLFLLPYYISKKIRNFVFYQPAKKADDLQQENILDRINMELLIPIIVQNRVTGFLLLGEKVSKAKYSEEDMELLNQMAVDVFLTLEHLRLQESMIIERAEREKLEELNRLKSEFVSLVSHELRTPLTSICWSVENLLDGIPEKPGPKIREYLKGIHNSSSHLTRMIENLLNISRIEAGKIENYPEKLQLQEQINLSLELLKPLAGKKKLKFDVDVNEDLYVKADRDHLKEILTNLVDNAIKYSNEEKIIQVKTQIAGKQESQKSGKNIEGMAAISVIDHGIGIPKEKQKYIFERFERIKEDRVIKEKGLGLGLHIVRKLVELQGGWIWVESGAGQGSTFVFTLPVAKSD